jgi:hypothetical protein
MAANNIYIQVDLNSSNAQTNVNALNNALAQTGPTSEKSAQQTTKAINSISVQIQQTTRSFSELSAALAGLGLERFAQNIIQVGSEFSRSEQMIARFTASAAEARRAIEDFRAIGKESLFPPQGTVAAGQRLLAAGMGIDQAKASLKAFNDLAAATGGSMEEVAGNVSIYVRMMNKDLATAMDLMRKLPASGVPIGPVLKKAFGTDDLEEAIKILKNGGADVKILINDINEAIEQKFGGAAESVTDLEKKWKNLGYEVKRTYEAITSDQGFGKQLKDLTAIVGDLFAIFRELLDLLMKLPDPIKDIIVFVGAFATATVALGSAWKILGSVLGPGIELLRGMTSVIGPAIEGVWALTRALSAGLIAALTNPAVLVAIGAVTALTVGFATFFPEQFKKLENQATTWVEHMWATVKEKAQGLASGARKALFPEEAKAAADAATAAAATGTGDARKETADNLKAVQMQVDKWAGASGRSLLESLGAPADAVEAKYKELFAQLDDLQKSHAISEVHAAEQAGELKKAKALEKDADILKHDEKATAEKYKREGELAKASYDAQIEYQQALDEQGLRNKVAAIDRITQLRIESIKTATRIENEGIEEAFQKQRTLLTDNAEFLKKMGFDVEGALNQLREDSQSKEEYNTLKQTEEEKRIRLEGWKKTNDLIIEDQKRVYEAFQGMFDEIFDAFTQKTKSIGQALGDVFKKLALGELKNFFSSQAATFATELAGYGTPEPGIRRSGGILGALLQRGMPPRPIMAPPEAYVPKIVESGVRDYGDVVEDATGKGSANRVISDAAGVYNVSAIVFANAVNKFANVQQESSQGYAERRMESSADISEASDAIQKASAATGVPVSLLRAMAQTESGFRPDLTSPKGAQGLFQLMPSTLRQWGITNPFDAYQSAIGGAEQLQWLLKRYGGDLPKALAAYNYGPGNYDKAMAAGRPLPPETQAYVAKVMGLSGGGSTQAAAITGAGGPVYDVGTRFSTTAYGIADTGAGGGLPLWMPNIQPPAASVTMAATPTEIAQAKQTTGVLAALGGLLGTTVGKTAGAGGGTVQATIATRLANLKTLFGIGGAQGGGTSLGSVLGSKGIAGLAAMGGMALIGAGLNKRAAPVTVAGGALAGFGMASQLGMTGYGGAIFGAGAGLTMAGIQRGGFSGMGMDVAGGAIMGFQLGGPIGAAIGAAAGAVAGAVRLFVKTEQEKIRAQIKQVYGIDIPNRQILTQIQQVIDQNYGGNVAVGVRSSQVQDLVRLYALSTGQAANMPRPMYAATVAQSTQGLQLQPVYQGGTQVTNPYTGPTTYQYQTAVAAAGGLLPGYNAGTGMGVPGAQGLINTSFQQLTLQAIQGNPSSIAMANGAAATAGDSRLTQTAAMQEPLTSLG